jgi:hypothetical protein
VAAAVVVLALVETVNAVVAPMRVPSEKDWVAAAAKVRSGFRPGDLIVAAPAWADALMRVQLGDLVPAPVAGRMDDARFARVWQIAQRGAKANETAGAKVASTSRHGALTVTLWERPAARVTFDFTAAWQQASMSVVTPDRGELPCWMGAEQFECSEGTHLKLEVLEIDTTLRNALGLEPHERTTTVLDYTDVLLGRELAVAGGLHNVWLRKTLEGKVRVRVLLDGHELGALEATSTSGWAVRRFDTAAMAGKTGKVRFEITVDRSPARYLGFAAEARDL